MSRDVLAFGRHNEAAVRYKFSDFPLFNAMNINGCVGFIYSTGCASTKLAFSCTLLYRRTDLI